MTLEAAVRAGFKRSFQLYHDLAASLDAAALGSKLPDLPSNTIGAQLWCVVGARESYAGGIAAGGWTGFSCSLKDAGDPSAVREALARSEAEVNVVLDRIQGFTDAQSRLLVEMLEHEAQHHGQLIRYMYGLKLAIPESWKERYALD